MAAITIKKLIEVYEYTNRLLDLGENVMLYAKGTGELVLCPSQHPSKWAHDYLLKKGFVVDDNHDYIYRPYRRKK